MVFGHELTLEFSSACTQVAGWQEVGSLNIRATNRAVVRSGAVKYNETAVSAIAVVSSEKLIYEDDDVVVECGLVLCVRDDEEILVAAGISPGAVSVRASFSTASSFEPQFPLSMCRRQRM